MAVQIRTSVDAKIMGEDRFLAIELDGDEVILTSSDDVKIVFSRDDFEVAIQKLEE